MACFHHPLPFQRRRRCFLPQRLHLPQGFQQRPRLAAVLLVVALVNPAWAANTAAAAKPQSEPLAGLVPAPAHLPGIGRWQMAHKIPHGRITAVAWSPDGKSIAYGEFSYVRVCDAKSFETRRIFAGHSNRITAIDWNRITNRLATSSLDGTVRVWSADGVPESVFKDHVGPVNGVAWSPDGKQLASAGEDGTVRIQNGQNKPRRVIHASEAAVNCVAWNPDGKQLVAGDDKCLVTIWNADGAAGPVCYEHLSPVTHVDWSPDGKRIASSTWAFKPDGREREYHTDVRIWTPDGHAGPVLKGKSPNAGMRWSPDGTRIAVADEREGMVIWDPTRDTTTRPDVRVDTVTSQPPVAWSPDGSQIVLGSDGRLMLVDVATGSSRVSHPRTQGLPYQSQADWSSDGAHIAILASNHIEIRQPDGKPVHTFRHTFESLDVRGQIAWSPDGKQFIVAARPESLVARTDGGKADPPIALPADVVFVAWSPKSGLFAYATRSTIQFVAADGKMIARVQLSGTIGGLFWTRDGQRLAVLQWLSIPNRRFSFLLYDPQGNVSAALNDLVGECDSCDVSPDGKTVALGYDPGRLELWDFQHVFFARRFTPAHVTGSCMDIAYAPDGAQFVTVGWDGLVQLWKSDLTHVRSLLGHAGPLYSVRFSPDGQRFLTAGWDEMVRVWSLKSGLAETTIFYLDPQHSVSMAADGRFTDGDPHLIDESFVFLIEQPSGSLELIDRAEFLKRTGKAAQ
jgi:WD40 repeat protein